MHCFALDFMKFSPGLAEKWVSKDTVVCDFGVPVFLSIACAHAAHNLERPCCNLRAQPAAHSPDQHRRAIQSWSARCLPQTLHPSQGDRAHQKNHQSARDASRPSRNRRPPNALIPAHPSGQPLSPVAFACLSLFSPRLSALFYFPFCLPTARRHPGRGWTPLRTPIAPFAPVPATRQPHLASTPGRRPSPRRPQPFSLRRCHPLPSLNCQTSRFGRDRLCRSALRLPLRPRRTSLPGSTTPRLRPPTPRHARALT